MQTLRRGSEGEGVRRWQTFLCGRQLLDDVDGLFGPITGAATRRFQEAHELRADEIVGAQTYAAAQRLGFPGAAAADDGWPPRPPFAPLLGNAERTAIFGRFRYERIAGSGGVVNILDGWANEHIVGVTIPQLQAVAGAPLGGRVWAHRLIAAQLTALFHAWEVAGLLPLVKSWHGSFVPRFVRGSASTLSNHAWGTAFDINAPWNPLGAVPARRGTEGSVRELVPLAHHHGFFWGGHFSRHDGMHFEVAEIRA